MREIIFRGKRIDNDEWVEGWLFKRLVHMSGQNIVVDAIEIYDGKSHLSLEYYTVDPSTIGQYTGLNDKNGQKIFDGDIVVSTFERRLSNRPYVVEFCPLSGYWMCEPGRKPKIVGNIHDNPELLKGGVFDV